MNKLFFFLLVIPILSFSQSKEVSETEDKKIGEFYDEFSNSTFSMTKNELNYNLCFLNKITTESKPQTICLKFNEPEISMTSFFDFGLNFFDQSEMFLDKDWDMSQYKITVSKNGNFISLKIWDKYFRSLAITPMISKENWKKLFGKT